MAWIFLCFVIVMLMNIFLIALEEDWFGFRNKNKSSISTSTVSKLDEENQVAELQMDEIMEETEEFITKDLKNSLEQVKDIEDSFVLNGKEVPEEVDIDIDEWEEKFNSLYQAFESLKQEAEELKSEMDDYISDFE